MVCLQFELSLTINYNIFMEADLIARISYIFQNCHKVLLAVMQQDFPVAGNIGVFAQNEEEYVQFSMLAKQLTKASENPHQKYFELITPIVVKANSTTAKLTHLYIRKFDPSEYGKNLGDVDFVADEENYIELKKQVLDHHFSGASMYDRPGWDTIQMTKIGINVVAYLSTQAMAKKVRVKFDHLTNL